MTPEVKKTDEQWRQELSDERYRVLRQAGTERAFTGEYWDNHRDGVYRCGGCGAELFTSATKFDSGTGWPSFYEPAAGDAVETSRDWKMLIPRTEVHCRRCGGHLGHVFNDGPRPTGKRYCINSCSLTFDPRAGVTGQSTTSTPDFAQRSLTSLVVAARNTVRWTVPNRSRTRILGRSRSSSESRRPPQGAPRIVLHLVSDRRSVRLALDHRGGGVVVQVVAGHLVGRRYARWPHGAVVGTAAVVSHGIDRQNGGRSSRQQGRPRRPPLILTEPDRKQMSGCSPVEG